MRRLFHSGFCNGISITALVFLLFAASVHAQASEQTTQILEQINSQQAVSLTADDLNEIKNDWQQLTEQQKGQFLNSNAGTLAMADNDIYGYAKEFFSQPQNAQNYPEGAQSFLRTASGNGDYNRGAQFTIETSGRTAQISYNSEAGTLANGEATIALAQFSSTDRIEVLANGGFRINGMEVTGGGIDKQAGAYVIKTAEGFSCKIPFGNSGPLSPQQQGLPQKVTATALGFIIDGPVTQGFTVNIPDGSKVNVRELLNGRVAIGANGDIDARNADADVIREKDGFQYRYKGSFQSSAGPAAGQPSVILSHRTGCDASAAGESVFKCRSFYTFNRIGEVQPSRATWTNGGDVLIYSGSLGNANSLALPSNSRGEITGGIVVFDNKNPYDFVGRGFLQITGNPSLAKQDDPLNFIGYGPESRIERLTPFYDSSRKDEVALTMATGRFKLNLGGRIAADSASFNAENPEQVRMEIITSQTADFTKTDGPDNGQPFMSVKKHSMLLETVIPGFEDIAGVSSLVSEDPRYAGLSADVEIVLSKSNGNLVPKMTSETLSALGQINENPAFYIDPIKDFILTDFKDTKVNGEINPDKFFFLFTKEGGIAERSGSTMSIITNPAQVRSIIGDELILRTPEQIEAGRQFASVLTSADPALLMGTDITSLLAGLPEKDAETLLENIKSIPVYGRLISCIETPSPQCDLFISDYATFNQNREVLEQKSAELISLQQKDGATQQQLNAKLSELNSAKISTAQAYFDASESGGIIPPESVASVLTLNQLANGNVNGARSIADRYNKAGGGPALNRYVNAKSDIADMSARIQSQGRMQAEDINTLATNLFYLSEVQADTDPSSPVHQDAKNTQIQIQNALLPMIQQTIVAQQGQAQETFDSNYDLLRTVTTAGFNYAVDREGTLNFVGSELAYQALGTGVIARAGTIPTETCGSQGNPQLCTVFQVSSMNSIRRNSLINELYPDATNDNQAKLVSGLGSALNNPDVQQIANLEKTTKYTEDPNAYAVTIMPTVGDEAGAYAIAGLSGVIGRFDSTKGEAMLNYAVTRATDQKGYFPGMQLGMQYADGAEILEPQTSETLLGIAATLPIAVGAGAAVQSVAEGSKVIGVLNAGFEALRIPTLGPLATELGLQIGLTEGAGLLGQASGAVGLFLSNFVAISPASRAKNKLAELVGKEVEIGEKSAVKELSSGKYIFEGISETTGKARIRSGEEIIEVEAKNFMSDLASRTLKFNNIDNAVSDSLVSDARAAINGEKLFEGQTQRIIETAEANRLSPEQSARLLEGSGVDSRYINPETGELILPANAAEREAVLKQVYGEANPKALPACG